MAYPPPAAPRLSQDTPRPLKTREQWLEEAEGHWNAGRYLEALAAYEQALQFDSMNTAAARGPASGPKEVRPAEQSQPSPTAPVPAAKTPPMQPPEAKEQARRHQAGLR